MNKKLNQLTIKEALEGIKKKEFSALEIRREVLDRIEAVDGKLSAFLTIEKDNKAKMEEKGKNNLFLGGIPFAVKEVLSTKGIKTTASSKILENYDPVYNATVVQKLLDLGGEIIGKTNCDAFAFGASTENSGFGPTKNPWDLERVPGGSSGGSAAAVAADECIFALGTDTGGSIRQPASFCNVVGLKPTYGACSRYGLLAMASSFDCPGPMTKTVEDCEIIFNIMKGRDELDSTTVDYGKYKKELKKELIIGLPKEFFGEGIDKSVKDLVLNAVKKLQVKNFKIKEISLPNTIYGIAVYYILVPSEISSNMARYTGVRFGYERDRLEDEVKRRIMIGTYTLSAGYFDQYYLKAVKARSLIKKDFDQAFKEVDLIIGPVSPTPAFKLKERKSDPLKMYLSDILTVTANLAGVPGLSIPCGFDNQGLPVGMQIIGPNFSEDSLFYAGKIYQEITDWHKKRPKIENRR